MVGTIQVGLTWHLALHTGLLDVLWLFMAVVFCCFVCVCVCVCLSTMKIHLLPHPSWPVAFLSVEKQVENNLPRSSGKHCADLCP